MRYLLIFSVLATVAVSSIYSTYVPITQAHINSFSAWCNKHNKTFPSAAKQQTTYAPF